MTTTAGDELAARQVVVAVGAVPFAYAPPPLGEAVGDRVAFATSLQDYEPYRGRRVVVVGGGQGGLESASLAARAGAEVELVVRSSLRWFADREPHKPRGRLHQRLYRIAYPVVGYGPPPLNRLALHPDAFAALPKGARRRVAARILRAGGSPWLREEVERDVHVTEGVAVEGIEQNGAVRLRLSDGTVREADAVILAAGFRFSLERLGFLSEAAPQANRARRRPAGPRPLVSLDREGTALRRLRCGAPVRPRRPLHSRHPLHGQPREGVP